MKKSHIILTDSSGVQEEALSLSKPVLFIRDITERPEDIEVATAKLVGNDTTEIVSSVKLLINDQTEYNKMEKAVNPYGDGSAAVKIIHYKKNIISPKL